MTLAEMRTLAKRRADMENSRFVSDDEWTSYLRMAHAKLYDLLVASFEDYFIEVSSETAVASGDSTIPLAIDFYKLRGLDIQVEGSRWVNVPPFVFAERNSHSYAANRLSRGPKGVAYRLLGTNIQLMPPDQCAGVYRYWYIPRFVPMTLESDEPQNILDFEEFIVVDAARMALTKEESDTTALIMELEGLKARISAMAANRNAGDPERITDTSASQGYEDFIFPV